MKKNNKAFTLVEIMIAVVIIWIIWVWIASYDFNAMWDRQKLEAFTNKIVWEFEAIRTNALIWRWVWDDLLAPLYWELNFWIWNKWLEAKYYFTEDELEEWESFSVFTIPELYSIEQIICTQSAKNWENWWLWESETWAVRFKWSTYSLERDCNNNNTYQKVSLKIKYKDYFEVIEFNTINWLIEKIEKN